jgi:hypothetical protein
VALTRHGKTTLAGPRFAIFNFAKGLHFFLWRPSR